MRGRRPRISKQIRCYFLLPTKYFPSTGWKIFGWWHGGKL